MSKISNNGSNSTERYSELIPELIKLRDLQPDNRKLIDLAINLIEVVQEQDQTIEDLQNCLQELVQLLDNQKN